MHIFNYHILKTIILNPFASSELQFANTHRTNISQSKTSMYLKIPTAKGPLPRAHLVQNDSQRPDIRLETVLYRHAAFRTHIQGGPNASRGHLHRILQHLRNPEIAQLCFEYVLFFVPIHKNVLHLQISMQHLPFVQITHSQRDLRENVQNLILAQILCRALFFETVQENIRIVFFLSFRNHLLGTVFPYKMGILRLASWYQKRSTFGSILKDFTIFLTILKK